MIKKEGIGIDTGTWGMATAAPQATWLNRMPGETAFRSYGPELIKPSVMGKILDELLDIKDELGEIKAMLENAMETPGKTVNANVQLRKISLDQAKAEIAEYFKENDGREIGYEEIIETIGIEPLIVIDACRELEEEGKIG